MAKCSHGDNGDAPTPCNQGHISNCSFQSVHWSRVSHVQNDSNEDTFECN